MAAAGAAAAAAEAAGAGAAGTAAGAGGAAGCGASAESDELVSADAGRGGGDARRGVLAGLASEGEGRLEPSRALLVERTGSNEIIHGPICTAANNTRRVLVSTS